MGPSLAGYGGVARAGARRVSSGKVSFFLIGAAATGIYTLALPDALPVVPTEPEAAQKLLGPMGSLGLCEN